MTISTPRSAFAIGFSLAVSWPPPTATTSPRRVLNRWGNTGVG
jgi:hypothetical protein